MNRALTGVTLQELLKKAVTLLVLVALVVAPYIYPGAPKARAATIRVFLTTGTSYTIPSDWNNASNTIEVIGGGGGGGRKNVGVSSNNAGGGGGAYTKAVNITLTPGASVTYSIGSGGGGATANNTAGTTGGDTYFCNSSSNCATISGTAVVSGAKGGVGGVGSGSNAGGAGGASGSGVATSTPNVKNSGGAGGGAGAAGSAYDGMGGGGAGGPKGNGAVGADHNNAAGVVPTTGGTGGGGGGGGFAGIALLNQGSTGGNSSGNIGGGAAGTGTAGAGGGAGSNGGGGGGGAGQATSGTGGPGANGGSGIEWDNTRGSGGGGGGAGGTPSGNGGVGGNGGLYGGGGAAGGYGPTTTGNGGNGAQGIIVITYDTTAIPIPKPHTTITLTVPTLIKGNLSITYNLSKGSGTFLIDDPIDPVNKLLYHSFVESPDAKNIYDGIVTLNDSGSATVSLPGYFLALNQDFRYLGTPIGKPMPNLHISGEVSPALFGLFGTPQFTISGGEPGGRVSWQVTGVRHDLYIEQNPSKTEVDKGPDELVPKGTFLYPDLYNSDGTQKN